MNDAIVVGAGLSGLVCARRLAAAGLGVVVLEARDRIGGRLLGGRVGDTPIDLGGQWMSVGQPRLAALAHELGVASAPQLREGRPFIAEPPAGFFAQVATAIAQLRAVRRIERTHDAPGSLADWLEAAIRDRTARARIAMHAELVFAVEPAALSASHYFEVLHLTGGFRPAGPDLPGGGREHRFTPGAHELAARLAPSLDIRLGEPVLAIDDTSVRTTRGLHTARRIVLALPPSLVRGISIALPSPMRAVVDTMRAGPVVKCFAAYDRPFWRDQGWSGEAYRPHGTVRATVALAPSPVLLSFVVGLAASAWSHRDPAERRAEILATLASQFGPLAATPLAYTEHDWGADPWSAGCVAGLPPGPLDRTAWRAPHSRIHIAGTESAALWPGYMEGAIEAGERAAAEVLAVH